MRKRPASRRPPRCCRCRRDDPDCAGSPSAGGATKNRTGCGLCQWWLVEIDRAIVFQPWVDLGFTRSSKPSFASSVEPGRSDPGGHWHVRHQPQGLRGADRGGPLCVPFPSSDVRFLGASLLDPATLSIPQPRGRPTHVIAVFVGVRSTNCLSAIYVDRRPILLNGTFIAHSRSGAWASRTSLAWSPISRTTRRERTPSAGRRRAGCAALPDFKRRPPLFKDYFDPAVRRIVPTAPSQTLLKAPS